MIELRCDTASMKQMLVAVEAAGVPVIVTVRPTWEGGFSTKSDAERLGIWEAAMEAGAEYVDVELASWEKSRTIREVMEDVGEKHGTRLILSNHCFDGRPRDLKERVGRLRAIKSAAVLKIAWKAESVVDAVDALQLIRQSHEQGRTMVALAMGDEGVISRLLARKFGAPFTFASAERGKESAPGQPTVAELRERYRWEKQKAETPVFGVVGWPVGHSLSPHIHNAGFDATGVEGVYVPLAVKPDYAAFTAAVETLRNCAGMNLRGLSITIPHKENAMRYVKERGGQVDELSSHIGVINTIVWPAGREKSRQLRGLNSDYAGALDAIASAWGGKREALSGKRVAVMGAGGAARAIVAGLAACGANVEIFNRTSEKAAALAVEFGILPSSHLPLTSGHVVAAPWETLSASHADAYINCTPVGMFPKVNASPLDGMAEPAWTSQTVVFDTVYNPQKTRLLRQAEKKGARIVTGVEMFIRQAAVQFREFTGTEPPVQVFRETMAQALA
jgi:3-dehydroquinate dehydratase/shikimate dehydrogenase